MESIIQSVNNNITRIGLILVAMSAILLVAVVVLINNTIKLALFSQRFLIRSMQLVGAKPFFIQFPFMKRSIFHGLISGLIASLFIFLVLNYAQNRLIELSELVEPLRLFLIFTGISLLGGLIGFFSTFRAVRKYINMSLDELY
jgi:cell division transport system permease protein